MKSPTCIPFRSIAFAALAVGLAGTAYASDGTITFQGEVSGQTCTINGGTPTFTVTLPTVPTSALGTANATAGRTPFSIALTACTPDTGTVATYFEPGANTDVANHYLLNTGTATNVAVQVLTPSLAVIQLGNGQPTQGSQTATLSSGAATLDYYAEYRATAGAAGVGTVLTSTTYSIVYP